MAGTTWRALLLLGVVLTVQLCGCTAYVGGGFSVEFIHRDSPKSPLHDPSLTSNDRVLAAVRRSTARSYTVRDPSGGVAEIRSSPYEYLMYVNIGTPRTRMLAIVSTGSNLMSFKCTNGTSGPPPAAGAAPVSYVFDTSSSSSYGLVACRLPSCHAVRVTSCDANSICQYHFSYSDRSTTDGILSTETFIFDDAPGGCVGCRERPQLQLTRVNFGCNTNTNGGNPFLLAGNVGLGAGSISLVNQIGAATSLGRRFSYCLAPFSVNASSIINFGARAAVTEPGAVTTPLIPSAVDAYYTILLTSVKIGNSTIALLDPIMGELTKSIKLPLKQSPEKLLDLCYDVGGTIQDWVLEKLFPEVTLGFGGGAVITLKAKNAFIQPQPGTVCLAMSAATDNVAVIGNIAQQNFWVGFDLDKGAITFAAADCAKSYPSPPASNHHE
ncbi:aspartic proteinase CDR1-like [Triticum dicoccoides]|uniref:aspartic proteinase CDR1-like n=1 Tax=Triticum dicoccoides TaxID=85692 RepID=UPI00188E4A1B|nr:aspartic proteinase CDR1-like [Triticum dicoccoides]